MCPTTFSPEVIPRCNDSSFFCFRHFLSIYIHKVYAGDTVYFLHTLLMTAFLFHFIASQGWLHILAYGLMAMCRQERIIPVCPTHGPLTSSVLIFWCHKEETKSFLNYIKHEIGGWVGHTVLVLQAIGPELNLRNPYENTRHAACTSERRQQQSGPWKLLISRPAEDPVSKEVDNIPKDKTQGCPLASTCMCNHTHTKEHTL